MTWWYTLSNIFLFQAIQFSQWVLFKTIQLRTSIFSCLHSKCQKQIYFKQFSLVYKEFHFKLFSLAKIRSLKCQNSSISSNLVQHNYRFFFYPYQVLPLWARVDPEAMAMKGYSAFPKAPALLEPHHQIVQCHISDTHWGRVLSLCREAVGVFYMPQPTWHFFFYKKRPVL